MLATIALETGLTFSGRLFGAPQDAAGEIVFHTGMTGYQEILTDPSYAGQIVVFTASHIGNYGIHEGDDESPRIHPAAVIVRDFCRRSFHRQSERGLDDLLRRAGVPALSDVDTRALTTEIREKGSCRALIARGQPEELLARVRSLPGISDTDWVSRVTCSEPWIMEAPSGTVNPLEVAVLDLGVKRSILGRLAERGCRLHVFPAHTPAEELLGFDGVFLSNGPGDPATLPEITATASSLLDADKPVFGICLGHQLLARALGAETIKLPFGHHGANHPVQRVCDGRMEITSQNHNYAVPPESLPEGVQVTHLSLNDGTVEGMEIPGRPVYSVQYHPEAAPGPSDSRYLFDRFRDEMRARRTLSAKAGC
ncbi:MAG: glutamine-hydrolyzing carbamoyl-phosphate synthase small subunit [Candidatus Krumholzibacteria bacterium]|jgi:carbamoyl-phosphate synthase small subunit|nr:glutamine-hydrolyzing carbamoyl-phosphate synthase small subunit [Candidatus Krumholzibacteria bacterium]MDP6668638.1 glutamine-hydrolyzing carbamoyl-phosphate synthase small subunit [Candidatus Krumholzibacteria bacterium]MDP6798190.1 glutamine-hydrolyzing carbamoyl-phosphate synthase small subunit [Candidatus Krumholzibacteria bacterium]MDP7022413.1 glutamine-hydrolyzing carbamoyl-phosphate synthase small subunit [Candidatus Krumholzibacteria bacterium]